MTIRLMPAFLAATFALTGLARAYTNEDRYVAISNTAMSITGDIFMDDFGIAFQNGEALTFDSLVADHFTVDGSNVPASLYSVESPGDPTLENGNQLCGSGDVTYIATWAAGSDLTQVAVFATDGPPDSDADMCASYTYSQ